MSRKRTSFAFFWMKLRRDSTSSPIRVEKISSAAAASSMVTWSRVRVLGIHRGLPQLLVVHLAETLVALDAVVLRDPLAAREPVGQQRVALAVAVDVLVRGVRPLEPVQRRLREVDVADLDERRM